MNTTTHCYIRVLRWLFVSVPSVLVLVSTVPGAHAQSVGFTFYGYPDFVSQNISATGVIDVVGGAATSGTLTLSGVTAFGYLNADGAYNLVLPNAAAAVGSSGGNDFIGFNNIDDTFNASSPNVFSSHGIGFANSVGLVEVQGYDFGNNGGVEYQMNYQPFVYVNGEPGEATFFGDGSLVYNAIPEPSTYAAILGVVALGFVVVRRRGAMA